LSPSEIYFGFLHIILQKKSPDKNSFSNEIFALIYLSIKKIKTIARGNVAMEKVVDALMTQDLLYEFLHKYALKKEVKKLGDFENFVYEVYKDGQPYILRLTHSSHRSKEEIASELDWMQHLYKAGLSVPEVYPSINGQLVEAISAADDSVFFGCLYAKVNGEAIGVRSEKFNEELFKVWGQTTGQMHQATKSYTPAAGINKRASWEEDDLIQIEKYYPVGEQQLVSNAKEVIASVSNLSINPENFGVIHTDIHSGNFFYDGEKIHVFDFDDASYHWFASDIAIPLFYSVFYKIPQSQQEERQQFANRFLNAFIEGYQIENKLPEGWKEQVPLFLMLRDVVLYAVLHKKIAPEDREERLLAMMDEIEDRIRNKRPIVNVN
jgi:amicoumacin kinase